MQGGLPDAGTTEETNFTFTDEERSSIAENMTVFTQQPNWWSNESTTSFHHAYLGFVQGGWSFLKDEWENNSASIQEQFPRSPWFPKVDRILY